MRITGALGLFASRDGFFIDQLPFMEKIVHCVTHMTDGQELVLSGSGQPRNNWEAGFSFGVQTVAIWIDGKGPCRRLHTASHRKV
jgi:hypothetical protein